MKYSSSFDKTFLLNSIKRNKKNQIYCSLLSLLSSDKLPFPRYRVNKTKNQPCTLVEAQIWRLDQKQCTCLYHLARAYSSVGGTSQGNCTSVLVADIADTVT